ncbi:MAG TPA: DoxX family protein [Acidimicrobiales bacterium]
MALSRRIARPLLASVFLSAGVDTLRNPESRVKQAEPVTKKLAQMAPSIPDDTELLVRVNAGVQVGAAALLAAGKLPRLSALILAGSLVPTTLAGHRFWEEVDPAKRKQQQVHFLKNASLLGGLLIASVDTGGAPSLTWRAKRAARRAGDLGSVAHDTADAARGAAHAARRALPVG